MRDALDVTAKDNTQVPLQLKQTIINDRYFAARHHLEMRGIFPPIYSLFDNHIKTIFGICTVTLARNGKRIFTDASGLHCAFSMPWSKPPSRARLGCRRALLPCNRA